MDRFTLAVSSKFRILSRLDPTIFLQAIKITTPRLRPRRCLAQKQGQVQTLWRYQPLTLKKGNAKGMLSRITYTNRFSKIIFTKTSHRQVSCVNKRINFKLRMKMDKSSNDIIRWSCWFRTRVNKECQDINFKFKAYRLLIQAKNCPRQHIVLTSVWTTQCTRLLCYLILRERHLTLLFKIIKKLQLIYA